MPASLRVIGRALIAWWDDWIQLVIVNLVWAALCLTVVLAPPATFGLYVVTHSLRQGRSRGVSGLFEAVRRHFWVSWAWALLNLVAGVLLYVSYTFYSQIDAVWAGALTGLTITMAVTWLVTQFYALPFFLEQDQRSLKLALRNGLFMSLAAPVYTLVVAGAALVVLVAGVLLIVPLILGAPCLIAILGHCAVHERLVAYGKRPDDEAPPAPSENPT